VGAIFGAVVIMYAKSLVSEAWPQGWLFIQGGLFILVVTVLPEGVIGWFRGDSPGNALNRLGSLLNQVGNQSIAWGNVLIEKSVASSAMNRLGVWLVCRGQSLNNLGIVRRSGTYPQLEFEGQEEVQP